MSILRASKFRYGSHGFLEAYVPVTGSWIRSMDPLPEDAVPENTRPKIMFRDHITREMVQSEPAVLFVFGDNLKREGLGGQAKAMRGEHNAVGIPTKKEPTTEETAYFCDADFKMWQEASYADWRRLFDHVKEGGHIVWPSNGIGSGLAKLQEKAPEIDGSIKRNLQAMIDIAAKLN